MPSPDYIVFSYVPRLKLGWVPLCLGLMLSVGVAIVLIIALARHDVHPLVPYISEAGGKQPESGIFAILLFLGSVLSFVTMYSRYHIVAIKTGNEPPALKRLNKAGFGVGIVALVGMIMVGAYPIFILPVPHYVGAFLFFQCSVIYIILQAVLSHKICPECNGIRVVILRFTVSILGIICFIIFLVTNHKMFGRLSKDETKIARAKNAGAIAEWVMAMCLVVFFFSFIGEFREATLHVRVRVHVENFGACEEENRPLLRPISYSA